MSHGRLSPSAATSISSWGTSSLAVAVGVAVVEVVPSAVVVEAPGEPVAVPGAVPGAPVVLVVPAVPDGPAGGSSPAPLQAASAPVSAIAHTSAKVAEGRCAWREVTVRRGGRPITPA